MNDNVNKPELDSFVAVDVGNSGVKFGVFADDQGMNFPVASWKNDPADVAKFFGVEDSLQWAVSSVNSVNMQKIVDWITGNRLRDSVTILDRNRIPIRSKADNPMQTGLDRLLAALGAIDWLKTVVGVTNETQPLLVCDLGTAITIDSVTLDVFFHGGVILPGFELSAAVLHEKTELLPKIDVFGPHVLTYPATNTESSIASGIFWSVVGAIKLLADKAVESPYIVLNGFGSDQIARELRRYFPSYYVLRVDDLVLAGVRVAILA